MYQLVNNASRDVMFNVSSSKQPTLERYEKTSSGQNKDVLYISLALVIIILLIGLWFLYSHYIKNKSEPSSTFGYSI